MSKHVPRHQMHIPSVLVHALGYMWKCSKFCAAGMSTRDAPLSNAFMQARVCRQSWRHTPRSVVFPLPEGPICKHTAMSSAACFLRPGILMILPMVHMIAGHERKVVHVRCIRWMMLMSTKKGDQCLLVQ